MDTLGGELRGVRDIQWNSEPFIVFQTVILQQARHVTAFHDTRRWIGQRLDSCEAIRHRMLVEDTLITCAQYLNAARREDTKEQRAQTFHSLVIQGKTRTEVRKITNTETGGVLHPAERRTKT